MLHCSMPLIEQLGAMPRLKAADFLPKYAAEFVTADGSLRRRYAFADGLVARSELGLRGGPQRVRQALARQRDRARRRGAPRPASDPLRARSRAAAWTSWHAPKVAQQTCPSTPQMLIDASRTRARCSPGASACARPGPGSRTSRCFSHFEGATRYEGDEEGDISVVLAAEGWWWVIPLPQQPHQRRAGQAVAQFARTVADEAYFTAQNRADSVLRERLANATPVAPGAQRLRLLHYISFESSRGIASCSLVTLLPSSTPCFPRGSIWAWWARFALPRRCLRRSPKRISIARSSWPTNEKWREMSLRIAVSSKASTPPSSWRCSWRPAIGCHCARPLPSLLAGFGVDRFEVNWRVLVFRAIARASKKLELVPRIFERRAS